LFHMMSDEIFFILHFFRCNVDVDRIQNFPGRLFISFLTSQPEKPRIEKKNAYHLCLQVPKFCPDLLDFISGGSQSKAVCVVKQGAVSGQVRA
jgi:hypothetical protein